MHVWISKDNHVILKFVFCRGIFYLFHLIVTWFLTCDIGYKAHLGINNLKSDWQPVSIAKQKIALKNDGGYSLIFEHHRLFSFRFLIIVLQTSTVFHFSRLFCFLCATFSEIGRRNLDDFQISLCHPCERRPVHV